VFKYQKLDFYHFIDSYENDLCSPELFEQTIAWQQAVSQIAASRGHDIIVHCLFKADKLLLAWPLVHKVDVSTLYVNLLSLTSVYSAESEPLYTKKGHGHEYFNILFSHVCKKHSWYGMQLGAFNEQRSTYNEIVEQCKYVKTFSKTDNWYEDNIRSFEQYYDGRSSRLKNTVKRKTKQLAKKYDYQIKIISCEKRFGLFFPQYKAIYQKSWKGEEFSYDFIEKVCLKAIDENKLRFGLLFIDDIAVAAQIWFLQQGTASIFKLAYDPQYKQYSVGSILSMALSQQVIDIDKIHTIEFGMGSESYKKDWMSKCKKRATLQIFNHKTILGNILAFRYIALSKIKSWFLNKFSSE